MRPAAVIFGYNGSWASLPAIVRAANRASGGDCSIDPGYRVARTL